MLTDTTRKPIGRGFYRFRSTVYCPFAGFPLLAIEWIAKSPLEMRAFVRQELQTFADNWTEYDSLQFTRKAR